MLNNLSRLLTILWQIGHITSDNAANNGTATVALYSVMRTRDVAFHPEQERIRWVLWAIYWGRRLTTFVVAAFLISSTSQRLPSSPRQPKSTFLAIILKGSSPEPVLLQVFLRPVV